MESIANSGNFSVDNVLDTSQEGVFIVDSDRRVVLFNEACERLTGLTRKEVLGTQCPCRQTEDCDQEGGQLLGNLCPGLTFFERPTLSVFRRRMRIRRRDGQHAWVETDYTPLPTADGNISCVLAVVRDLSAVKGNEEPLPETTQDLAEEVEQLRGEIRQRHGFSTIISRSPRMEPVFAKIRAAADNDCAVLVSGESGAGKELAARTIHENGLHKNGLFVPMNCSSIVPHMLECELFGYVKGAFNGANIDFEGLLRAAEGGTIFLDEVTELTPDTQAKLLRVLEDGRMRPVGSTRETPVNVRVIAATSFNPSRAVAEGTLRKDLFYRLGVVDVEIPPLRERREDIPFLVQHFLTQLSRRGVRQVKRVDAEVWSILLSYDWPGNIRELHNAIESAAATSDGPELKAAELPELVRGEIIELRDTGDHGDLSLDDILASVERRAILSALRRAGGQRSRAARAIGISRSRLYRRMEALGIRPREDL
jgi:PAS domain S-box-containing protein